MGTRVSKDPIQQGILRAVRDAIQVALQRRVGLPGGIGGAGGPVGSTTGAQGDKGKGGAAPPPAPPAGNGH